jgi:vacuolar-type H+-ATPase subunit E/Vma4
MAIETLLDALGTEAERDAQHVTDAARAEAARIRAEAEARLAQQCNAALALREAELRASSDARRAAALRDARAGRLRARDEFLDRVFTTVTARLPGTLDDPTHADALTRLAHEALQYVPGEAVVRCRASLARSLNVPAAALGNARIVADDSVAEGVVVAAEDGSVTIDNTLESRLHWLRSRLAIDLLARFESEA